MGNQTISETSLDLMFLQKKKPVLDRSDVWLDRQRWRQLLGNNFHTKCSSHDFDFLSTVVMN